MPETARNHKGDASTERRGSLRTPAFGALCCALLATSALTRYAEGAEPPTTWPRAMTRARSIARASLQAPGITCTQTRIQRKGDPPVRIEADVRHVPYIWLVVGDGGNGFGCDHAAWGEPTAVLDDGATQGLWRVDPLAVTVGWFELRIGRNSRKRPVSIGGKPFPKSLFAHSPSAICFERDPRWRRVQAEVGIDDQACGGSVTFTIVSCPPPELMLKALWETLSATHPRECEWLSEDLGKQADRQWFLPDSVADLQNTLIRTTLRKLGEAGREFRQTHAELQQENVPPESPKWLELYARCRERLHSIQQLGETLRFAQKTLDFITQYEPRPELLKKLQKRRDEVNHITRIPGAPLQKLQNSIRQLRKTIILSHPDLAFTTLMINKRPTPTYSHQCDQYLGRHSRAGPGLVLLKNWKSNPTEIPLTQGKLPPGTVAHPDLAFNAKHVAFAFCDHTVEPRQHRRFLLYEMAADGSNLKRLTGTKHDPMAGAGGRQTVLIEDFDPCYLPNGQLVFVSTRNQTFGRCHYRRYNPSYLLHLLDRDNLSIRQLSFGEANEWDPSVLHDGRIVYTRWDYINRHDTIYQSLWTTRPDGTNVEHLYGNYTRNPCMIAEARSIPRINALVATATAHHAYTSGSLIRVDPLRGRDGKDPVERLTPEVPFPETEGWPGNGCFATPWPINDDLFLAARCDEPLARQGKPQSVNAYSIYLVDSLGGRERIYSDPEMSCFAPIPLRPRPRPPILGTALPPPGGQPPKGSFFVRDAAIASVPLPERIVALRVNEIIGQPTAAVPHRGVVRQEIVKKILGTTPVNDNGTAAFEAPAGVPLQLQALDRNGMAVMTMRSFVYLQPGESASCIGCHENRHMAPPTGRKAATDIPVGLNPPAGPRYKGGFSFARTVQPVLDRYCIRCHGLGEAKTNLCLLGTPATLKPDGYPGWPAEINVTTSYAELTGKPGLVKIAQRNRESGSSKPDDYFARAGKLAPMLVDGHCKALLENPDALQCIVDWLDLNAQFNGDYSWNRTESRKPDTEGERKLRTFIRKSLPGPLAEQPFAALVNVALPSESRIIRMTLPTDAGGWGQVQPPWKTDDPRSLELAKWVNEAITPLPTTDVAGTCGKAPCKCGCCWVRDARKQWREHLKPLEE